MKCRICGAELEASERRCRYCGNEISAAESETGSSEKTDKGDTRAFDIENSTETPERGYVRDTADINTVSDNSAYNDVVLNRENIKRAAFCSKCGRPLDGRTGKCIVCDYAAVGRAAHMMNNSIKGSGDAGMAGRNKKKKNTTRTVVLSVLGIMAVFAIAFVAAFYMMGGFDYDEEPETPAPAAVTESETEAAERATEIPAADTPRTTAAPAARPVVTSSPSMEPKKGDPAEFKGGSYIYPSHKQVITEAALESYAPTEKTARLLYYELFARYGMDFDDDDLIDYFEGQVWYTPDGGSSKARIRAQFNDVEKENEKIIREYMKNNGWN